MLDVEGPSRGPSGYTWAHRGLPRCTQGCPDALALHTRGPGALGVFGHTGHTRAHPGMLWRQGQPSESPNFRILRCRRIVVDSEFHMYAPGASFRPLVVVSGFVEGVFRGRTLRTIYLYNWPPPSSSGLHQIWTRPGKHQAPYSCRLPGGGGCGGGGGGGGSCESDGSGSGSRRSSSSSGGPASPATAKRTGDDGIQVAT